MISFKDAVGYLYIVREKIREVDTSGLFKYYCPNVKTTEVEINSWEKENQLFLPDVYKQFLLTANGWKCVSQDINLFRLEELTLSKSNKHIKNRDFSLQNLTSNGNEECLLPIGASDYSCDQFLMILDAECNCYGQVLWVAGEEIERYKDFAEFFLSLIQYNKYNYELLTGKKYD